MRALLAALLLSGCAGPLTAPAGVTIPLGWAGLPLWKIRILTGALHITTPLVTIEPRADGVLGMDVMKEF